MIDHYPKDQYERAIQKLKENPIPEIFKGQVYCDVNMLFLSLRKNDPDYNNYPIFEEIGLSREDFNTWNQYENVPKDSIEYKKLLRKVIIGLAAWQWKYSRLLDKRNGLIIHDTIMDQYILKLEEINSELGISNSYQHEKTYNEKYFITSDKQLITLNYGSYNKFIELEISEDDFVLWNKYMDLDRSSIEYKKIMRECICNFMIWQWKYSKILEKSRDMINNNLIMLQYILKLQELDKELSLPFHAGYM